MVVLCDQTQLQKEKGEPSFLVVKRKGEVCSYFVNVSFSQILIWFGLLESVETQLSYNV